MQAQRQECEEHSKIQKESERVVCLEKNLLRDNKLASEMDKLKRPEIREAKLR